MSTSLNLADAPTRSDLAVFAARAARLDDSAIRLVVIGRVLAVSAPVLYPRGIMDRSPTILGMRTFALAEAADVDVVVTPQEILDRLARLASAEGEELRMPLPPSSKAVSWAGQSAPRGGWVQVGELDTVALETVAKEGAAEIAAALPEAAGDHIVQKVRSTVWSQPLAGGHGLPAGAAFAAVGLGFLGAPESARVFASGAWSRLTTDRGHVLAKTVTG
ncbi:MULTISPECIES: hypothetical protein [unclassified Plantibacter]|jgi:hypothetical protein|uniref:hypothetical protein n=1 Tax=unclassified Plantibacter TaxID=2624265 RepID=UPI003D33A280